MEKLSISNQTLRQFIDNPFGIPENRKTNKTKQMTYESRYLQYKKNNKIKVESTLIFEDNYFIHLKVPSESQKGEMTYDVVVQFFTTSEKRKADLTLDKYYVQFFSNSPGFVYKYASLYKLQGYLIESLYDKFQPGALETLPDNVNSNYELYYDSSIYYACRYLIDNKIRTLGKLNIKIFKSKRPQQFFEDIQDIESMDIVRATNNFEASLRKEIQKDTKLSQDQEIKLIKKSKALGQEVYDKKKRVKKPKLFTTKDSDGIKIIKPVKSAGKRAGHKSKIQPKKSTIKKK